jgi:regulator of protease activity HflC (stomatin/prohibitin superfamily)
MADIKTFGFLTFGFLRHLRADAGVHVMRFRNGRPVKSGRGLAFWFIPHRASIAELPVDDRNMVLFFKGRSKDFQAVTVQGNLTWRVADPDVLGMRVDFSIDLKTGRYRSKPVEQIEDLLTGMSQQLATQYLAQGTVHELLNAGIEPLRVRLEQGLGGSERLTATGVEIVAIRLAAIAPTAELERALQTPTFEGLQQKADEAVFERRALAVEKERAIAENELHNKTELARREQELIAQEAANARNRAEGACDAMQIAADGEAGRIRTVEQANTDMEQARFAIYRDLPAHVQLGLAARAFAEKLTKVDHLNVTPDMLASVLGELGRSTRIASGGAGSA